MPAAITLPVPEPALQRFQKAGIDLNQGYPAIPPPLILQDLDDGRNDDREVIDPATRADPEKKALFSAADKVVDLTKNIGTEVVGLQLKDLTDQQKDELALLIAERGVVFFRGQDLAPQTQSALGQYWGRLYPEGVYVPGHPEISVIWPDYFAKTLRAPNRERPFQGWHTDMVHERYTPGITHLHNDTVPEHGGDLIWASGYAAYSKLSPAFRAFLDGKEAVFKSGISFMDKNNPSADRKNVERIHPIVRVHPATGWKSLFVNRDWMVRIVGFDKAESDVILNYLCDVYENSVDIQVRFQWTPGSSALFDNRIVLHTASWDYENKDERHGTKVTTLAEAPYFDPNAPTRREALGMNDV